MAEYLWVMRTGRECVQDSLIPSPVHEVWVGLQQHLFPNGAAECCPVGPGIYQLTWGRDQQGLIPGRILCPGMQQELMSSSACGLPGTGVEYLEVHDRCSPMLLPPTQRQLSGSVRHTHSSTPYKLKRVDSTQDWLYHLLSWVTDSVASLTPSEKHS